MKMMIGPTRKPSCPECIFIFGFRSTFKPFHYYDFFLCPNNDGQHLYGTSKNKCLIKVKTFPNGKKLHSACDTWTRVVNRLSRYEIFLMSGIKKHIDKFWRTGELTLCPCKCYITTLVRRTNTWNIRAKE